MALSEREMALEEWKQAGSIVSHHENLIFLMRGWLLTLITGMSLLLVKQDNEFMSRIQYLVLSSALIALFFILEVFLRPPVRNAIRRARKIERVLRKEIQYDGFQLSTSMGQRPDLGMYLSISRYYHVWIFYLVLILLVILATVTAPDRKPVDASEPKMEVKDVIYTETKQQCCPTTDQFSFKEKKYAQNAHTCIVFGRARQYRCRYRLSAKRQTGWPPHFEQWYSEMA